MHTKVTQLHHGSNSWFKAPQQNHLVHFYPFESDLITPLYDFISEGITQGDTCIAVMTQKHRQALHGKFEKNLAELDAAIKSGQYQEIDAEHTLPKLMVGGMPDSKRFYDIAEQAVARAAERGKPIRIYGEMVALLWHENNPQAMIQLEEFWNELSIRYPMSVFCAYPELHFDDSLQHKQVIEGIRSTHTITTGSFV